MVTLDKLVVFDIETMVNCFIACFYDLKTNKKKEFVFFDDEDFSEEPAKLIKFLEQLQKKKYTLIGFNSIGFDGQVIDNFIDNYPTLYTMKECVNHIYSYAQYIISIPEDERFDKLKSEKYLKHIHLDLFKQKHYDGKAKRGTSLKWLQFTMGYPNIEEMPIHHNTEITKDQIQMVVDYCWNDVLSTADFFKRNIHETELRISLSKEYKKNLLNASEPRLAKEIFAKFLCEDMGIEYSELRLMKTIRKYINFKDIIFDYTSFYTKPFQDVLNHFKSITIDASPKSEEKFSYSFEYKGVHIDLGLGGIHGCNERGVYEVEEDEMILDIDASSYYPNLAIQNKLKPEHLGDSFLRVYENLYKERKTIDKKDPRNYIYKIILNSTYGLSKEVNSYVYDPKFTYGITINGQLSLLMLTEMMGEYVKDLTLIQLNTDGITIKFKKKYYEKVMKICKQFETVTKQALEYAEYKKMVVYDVNNYLSIYTDGSVKKKGMFETTLDFHKNPSFLIIPKALSEYFINNTPYEKFIEESDNILDFCGGTKVKSNFTLNLYTLTDGIILNKDKQQKVTRYYISKQGGSLIKDFNDGRQVSVSARNFVTIFNKEEELDIHLKNINRKWYIQEVKKIIQNILPNKQQLELQWTY